MLAQQLRLANKKIPPAMTVNTRWRRQLNKLVKQLEEGEVDLIYFGRKDVPIRSQSVYLFTRERVGMYAFYRLRTCSANGHMSIGTEFRVSDNGRSEAIEDMMARVVAWFSVQQAQLARFPKLGEVDEYDFQFFGITNGGLMPADTSE
jgi:hypothetical protein